MSRALALLVLLGQLLVGAAPTLAQSAERGGVVDETRVPRITLATIGPGSEYWSRFGHNGLIVDDGRTRPRIYHFGAFDFEQPGFLRRFLIGRPIYSSMVLDARRDLAAYADEGRAIWLQPLDLPEPAAHRLAALLAESVRPENRDYVYDYFLDNCSTRIRDLLDAALDGELRRQLIGRSRGYTYRMQAVRLASPDLPIALGIHFGLGLLADRPLSAWAESFIPMSLKHYLKDTRIRHPDGELRPLVFSTELIHAATLPDPPELMPNWLWRFAVLGLGTSAVLLVLAWLRRWQGWARLAFAALFTAVYTLIGLAGLAVLGLWLLTEHQFAAWNENLFYANPLALLLLPMLLGSAGAHYQPGCISRWLLRLHVALAGLGAFLGMLPAFSQNNLDWILLLLPLHLALGLALKLGWLEPAGSKG